MNKKFRIKSILIGGFFSALDADSEGVEGKFYTWSQEEIDTILLEKASQLFQEKIMELTPGIAHVAIVHATVMGATFGSERNVMIGKDLELIKDRFPLPEVDE